MSHQQSAFGQQFFRVKRIFFATFVSSATTLLTARDSSSSCKFPSFLSGVVFFCSFFVFFCFIWCACLFFPPCMCFVQIVGKTRPGPTRGAPPPCLDDSPVSRKLVAFNFAHHAQADVHTFGTGAVDVEAGRWLAPMLCHPSPQACWLGSAPPPQSCPFF